jgi:hypothetical protein
MVPTADAALPVLKVRSPEAPELLETPPVAISTGPDSCPAEPVASVTDPDAPVVSALLMLTAPLP